MKPAESIFTVGKIRLATLLFISLSLSGCAVVEKTLEEFEKPTAQVNSVSLTDVTLQTATLLFDLSVNNPNAIPIESEGLDYNLSISQKSLVSVNRSREKIDLPARGRGKLSVPVTVNFADVYDVASTMRGRNEIDYAMELGIYFDLPLIGQFRVPISYQDSLPIPRLPSIGFAGVNLENVSLGGADIVLELDISNGNSFGIDLNQLTYQISANGTPLGRGQVASINMPENNRSRLKLPLNFKFDRLGTAMYRLLSSNDPVTIGFSGGVDLLPEIGGWKPDRLDFNMDRRLSR